MTLPSAPPRVVDRYALFDVIATGGMASVHLGRLIGPVGFSRTVAIKRLHENLARDPDFATMFLDEARLVARIRHPNVVQTLDVVASQHELLLVMEYVSGESLAHLIKCARAAGRLTPIPVVVDIVTGLLNGLHAAHEATNEHGEPLNVVHRDVSPHNVLVGTDGVTRVLDFGIAKAAGHVHHTRAGEVKGKIRYMPPEQIAGKEVTRAADIYAASVVLWEALTCSRLFSGSNDGEVVYRVMEGQIVPPSGMRRDVPPGLDAIVMRGLSRDPNARYATAKEMADVLERSVPAVTRSTVGAWVLDSARSQIREREECVARVEGTMTPVPPSLIPPSGTGTGDTTLSRVGSLSQSVAPDEPRAPGPRRKRWLVVAGLAAMLALAGLAPRLLKNAPVTAALIEPAAAPPAAPPEPAAAPEPESKNKPSQGTIATPAPPVAPPTAVASAAEPSVAETSAPAEPQRRRGSASSSSGKRSGSGKKGGNFDRIYRRD